ncbi:MAG: hypothetical protein ACHRHE_11915, partial [Tepidisphaerales bacterium]
EPSPRQWHFTVDRAYLLHGSGRDFWGFLDPSNEEHLDFQSPVRQFLRLRHSREGVEIPSMGDGDGNHSLAKLLARRDDGSAVFKIVYASRGGERPGQEDMRTFLLYRSPNGRWQLAATDIGHEGGTPHTRMGLNISRDMRVDWGTGRGAAPFTVHISESYSYWVSGDDIRQADYDYTTQRDGVLEGAFPMQLKMSPGQYAISDGSETLKSLAGRLSSYHSNWVKFAESVPTKEEAKRQVDAWWLEALMRANPGIQADAPVAKGGHIAVPDVGATANEVSEQFDRRFVKRHF